MKIMPQTNFQKITDFHIGFGHPYFKEKQINIFDKDPKLVKLRFDLINEEVNELNDAYKIDDVKEIIDALTDILYVVYGMAAAFGIDADKNFYEYLRVIYNQQTPSPDDKDLPEGLHGKSNYQLVLHITEIHYSSDIKKYLENIKLDVYRGILDYYLKQINYVNQQLKTCISHKVFNEVEDNINALLYYTYHMGIVCGVDLDATYTIVHDSNMSKICNSEEEAIRTIEWYRENDTRYDTPTYKKNDYGYVVFNESTGKILKNINYIPANFDSLLS